MFHYWNKLVSYFSWYANAGAWATAQKKHCVQTLGTPSSQVLCSVWVQDQDLVLRHRHCARILVWTFGKKTCVFTLFVPRPVRVILGHHAWVPSVSIAYKLTLISWLVLKLPNCLACSEQHVYSILLVKTPLNIDGPARSLMCWV